MAIVMIMMMIAIIIIILSTFHKMCFMYTKLSDEENLRFLSALSSFAYSSYYNDYDDDC